MKNWKTKIKKIKILAMDVDGVLTDGSLLITPAGEEVKIWNVKDRLAFGMLKKSGLDIKLVWITGRGCPDVKKRAEEVGVDKLFQKTMNKKEILKMVCAEYKIRGDQVLYIGDDLADIGALRFSGLAVCPQDAPAEIKKECDYVSTRDGGNGVVREVIELILRSHNVWRKVVESYNR